MKKLRLLVTEKCNRNCEGCCNKDIKPTGKIKDIYQLIEYDMVLITGGEPLLFPNELSKLLERLHYYNDLCPNLILYTAIIYPNLGELFQILLMLNGITFTIHDEKGLSDFIKLNSFIELHPPLWRLEKRLNVFIGIKFPPINLYLWQVKFIDWVKDCPLPPEEELFILEKPW